MSRLLTGTLLFLLVTACGSDTGPHKGFKPAAPSPQPQGEAGQGIGYDEVRPIFQRYCTRCHPALSPPDWMDYKQAHAYVENGKLRERVVVRKDMPLTGSPESMAISDQEREIINSWINGGGQQGGAEPAAGAPISQTAKSGTAEPSPVAGLPSEPKANNPQEWLQVCFGCHGPNGAGAGTIPMLAGQNLAYLLDQIDQFQKRERFHPGGRLANLSFEDRYHVAIFMSQQERRFTNGTIPEEIFQKGKVLAEQYCNSCHWTGENETAMAHFPRITGLNQDYIKNQLRAFRSGDRPGRVMPSLLTPKAFPLSDEEFDALAAYYHFLPRVNAKNGGGGR